METLSHNDILALNSTIGEIYAARDMESFYRSVFSSIQGIIPGELCSFSDFSLHPTRSLNGVQGSQDHSDVYNKHLPAFNAHLHEHPLNPHFFSGNVVKTTDYASRDMFKGTAIYNEYYRHLDIEIQIGLSIPVSQEKVSLFAMSRKCQDFSERDRLILTLLRPHLISAFRNVTELGRIILERDLLQKGAEAERQGTVLFQSDGMVLYISPFAKEMLERYFDTAIMEGDTLPGRLMQWFKAETNLPSSFKLEDVRGFAKRVEREPLSVENERRRLNIKLLKDFTTGEYVLVITEKDDSLILQNLQGYGLSSRETEVLELLSKGKTNVEIAFILNVSRRTVEKHVENIFEKLGVETRAAAAAMMQE